MLTAFKTTGLIQEPLTINEITTTDTVIWNMTRPSMMTRVYENLSNSYADENIKTSSQFEILEYVENGLDFPSWGNDYLRLRIRVRANVSDGFIYKMRIEFSETEPDANLRIYDDFRTIELDGCKQTSVQILGDQGRVAHFEAYGVDQPRNCSMGILVAWIFLDDNKAGHGIMATLETICFNGTVYKQVNIPISSDVIAE